MHNPRHVDDGEPGVPEWKGDYAKKMSTNTEDIILQIALGSLNLVLLI